MNPSDQTDTTPVSPVTDNATTKKADVPSSFLPLPDADAFPQWFGPALLGLALAWATLIASRESDLSGAAVGIVETAYLVILFAYYRTRAPFGWFGWTLAGSAWFAALWFAVFRSQDMGAYLGIVLFCLNAALPAYLSGLARSVWDRLAVFALVGRLVGAYFSTFGPMTERCAQSVRRTGSSREAARYALSLLVLGGILLFVLPLLGQADAAFAYFLQSILPDWLYELEISYVLRVAIWTIGFFFAVGTYVLAPSRLAAPDTAESGPIRSESPLSWPLILGGVTALYALYIAVQVRYFFLAADANVYQTFGLTYAEYIHKGFYELLAVSFINVAIAKVAFEYSREREDRLPSPVTRVLIAAVCACAIIIACSGVSRAWHYVGAYGLSIERMLVLYASFLAIGVFGIGILKTVFIRLREVPVAVALAITSFVALGYTNVESIVASYNIRTQSADKLDTAYILTDLSEDALDEKLWVLAHDPLHVATTRTDWDCRGQIDEAQATQAPKPNCDPEIDVTNSDLLYEWVVKARKDANDRSIVTPPSWYHANYSANRLYSDPTILSSYGEKLKNEPTSRDLELISRD